jgi:hypothetical protein
MSKQVAEWPSRVPKNRRKRKEISDGKEKEEEELSPEPPKQQHSQVTFLECLWPELNPYQVVAPDTLHQLQLGLLKHYLIPLTMELLRQNNNNPSTDVSCWMIDALDRQMSAISQFQGLRSLPDGRFSTVTQLTSKEYQELTRIFLVAVSPLLIHHPQHLEAIQAGIDFMLLASYQSHSDTTIQFLEKSLQKCDKIKWAFEEQRLESNGQAMGHFNIPKLHVLTQYSSWIKKMCTLDNVNTAVTEALHKTVKAAFCHSNKVDFIPQMCFWDDRRLSVEMREVTLRSLALDDMGHSSCKIHKSFDVSSKMRPARPLLASLKPYRPLLDVEKSLEVPGFQKAMLAYIKILHLQSCQAGRALKTDLYTTCLENPKSLSLSPASSAALTYLSFQGGQKFKRHLIRCTQNWRRKKRDLTMSSFKMKSWVQKKQRMLLEVGQWGMSCASLNGRQPVEWEIKSNTHWP